MQHIPSDVLQELQRKGEVEIEQGSGERGSSTSGARGALASRASSSSEASLTVAAQDSSQTGTFTTALFDTALKHEPERHFPPETPRREPRELCDGIGEERSDWVVRPGAGPRASSAPLRVSAATSVSPQFLGGSAEADANLLDAEAVNTGSISCTQYHIARKASAAEHMRTLQSAFIPRQELNGTATSMIEEVAGHTPSSSSDSPYSTVSFSSGVSTASSYAHLVRHSRADLRLFKKKSRPNEHLRKQPAPSPPKRPEIKRSPSYYKPKVIEDTARISPPPPLVAPPPLRPSMTMPIKPNDNKEFLLKLPAKGKASKPPAQPMLPIKTPRKLRLGTVSDPEPMPFTPARAPTIPQEGTLDKSAQTLEPPTKSTPPTGSRTAKITQAPRFNRLSSSPRLQPRSKSSEYSLPVTPKTPMYPESPPLVSTTANHKRHYHDTTPPEAESMPVGHKRFHHGDHYFKTFGHETMYRKELPQRSSRDSSRDMPETTPGDHIAAELQRRMQNTSATSSHSAASSALSASSLKPSPHNTIHSPSDPISESSRQNFKRKRSSVFKSFRKAAATDSVLEAPRSGLEGPSKRRRSSLHESYFHVLHDPVPHATSSPSSQNKVSQVVPHKQQWAEAPLSPGFAGTLSPLSLFKSRPTAWLRHQITLESIADADTDAISEARKAAPSSTAVSDRSGSALDVTPSPGARPEIDRERVHHRKLSGIKGIFRGFRNPFTGKRETPLEVDTPEPATTHRREGVLPKPEQVSAKRSFVSLIRKASKPQLNFLKHKASQATFGSIEEKPETLDTYTTEVTDFWQTPYSTRYNDTKKSESNAIRHMVDEALDDDEMMDVKLGFELNVPDHLPNSPLCPLDSRHKSGGKALCPLHGRKQKPFSIATLPRPGTRTAVCLPRPRATTASKVAPQIVYEGKLEWIADVKTPRMDRSGLDNTAALKSAASEGSLQTSGPRLVRQPTRKASVGWADQLASPIGKGKEVERRPSMQRLLSKLSEDGAYW